MPFFCGCGESAPERTSPNSWSNQACRFDSRLCILYRLKRFLGTKHISKPILYRLKRFRGTNSSVLKGSLVAAIWNDDDTNWKVEFFQDGKKDGKKVGDMKRVPSKIADICVTSYFFNVLNKNTSTWATTTAQHYWYIEAPTGDPTKEKNWEVRATQTIPFSGQVNVFTSNTLQTDYSGF